MKGDIRFYPRFVVRRPQFDCPVVPERIFSEQFAEAVYFASPELYPEYEKYCAGSLSGKDKRRMEDTLAKYLDRMTYRCTPFGTFALTGIGEFGDSPNVASAKRFRRHIRYDTAFMYKLQREFVRRSGVALIPALQFLRNNTCIRIEGEYHYSGRKKDGGISPCKTKVTPLLKSILKATSKPISYAAVENAVMSEFDISNGQLQRYIFDLVESDILLTNLNTETVGFDNLRVLVEATRFNGAASEMIELVNFAYDSLRELNSITDTADRIKYAINLCSKIREFSPEFAKSNILQVDSYEDKLTTVNRNVKDELRRVFEALLSLTRESGNAMSQFRQVYMSRYEMQPKPLLEVLDPEIGIGYGASLTFQDSILKVLRHKNQTDAGAAGMSVYLSPYERMVLDKIRQSHTWDAKEIHLDDSDFAFLPKGKREHREWLEAKEKLLPPTMACMYRIVGTSDDGSAIISNVHFSGLSALNLLTRFSDGDKDISAMIADIAEMERKHNPDIVLAEISHLTHPDQGNVQSRPALRTHNLVLMSYPRTDAAPIDLADLYLRPVRDRIILWSNKLHKEVRPCFTSAFNPQYKTSTLYRFLSDMQYSGGIYSMLVTARNLAFVIGRVPRVRYGNTILSAECLCLPLGEVQENGGASVNRFRSWCEQNKAPRYLTHYINDNFLVIDIDSDRSIEMFLKEIKGQKSVVLEEFLPTADDIKHQESVVEVIQPVY